MESSPSDSPPGLSSLESGSGEGFVAWARSQAVFLSDEVPWQPEVLAALDPLLEGKRFAFVGEGNHFIHEKYDYRILVIRYLVSRGWRVIGEELAWSDGLRVNRYIETGRESWLHRVATYGYPAGRSDRDDTPTGILRDSSENYPLAAFRAEQLRFDRRVREISERGAGGALRFFGFDVDYYPALGYEHLLEAIDDSDGYGWTEHVAEALRTVRGETLADEATRLAGAVERLEAAFPHPPGTVPEFEVVRRAHTLRDSHRYASMLNPAATYDELRPAMSLREDLMEAHVDHALARWPDEKFIFLSHSMHLARDDNGIVAPPGGVGPGGGLTPSIGHRVSARFPGEVFSIWMVELETHDSQPLRDLPQDTVAAPTTINALLARVGDCFVLPIVSNDDRARVLHQPGQITLMYGLEVTTTLAAQTDAVFFRRRTTSLQP